MKYQAIANYCNAALAPGYLTNGVAPSTFNTTINSTSYYTCNFGYSGSPSVSCLEFNQSFGVWSNLIGNCTGTNSFATSINIFNFWSRSERRDIFMSFIEFI